MNRYVKSPLNYVGGKYKLLPQLIPLFPEKINTFVDLFCGGCNVGANVSAERIICNDILTPVISLMNYFKNNDIDHILNKVYETIHKYGLTETSKYGYEYYGCNSNDGVAKVNKEAYLKLRSDYNSGKRDDITFYVMVIHAFSNYIGFNSKGKFNVAVNKRDFNDKLKQNLIDFVKRLQSINIEFTNYDYKELKIMELNEGDFVYLDPPYLITSANYNENGGWTEKDEKELLYMLDYLNLHKVKFALSNVFIHKGKENKILQEWAKRYNVHHLDYHYGNCNYQTKVKNKNTSDEVLITNY